MRWSWRTASPTSSARRSIPRASSRTLRASV
jgi:hypothetical protein